MEFDKIVKGRRSVRKYFDKKVEKEKIMKVIDAARYAPTACNYQNWHFVIVDDKNILEKLHFVGAFHVKISPTNIFVFYDKRFVNKKYQDHIQSASAAIMTIIYRAYELGLGTCWVCDLPDENLVKKILCVPKYYQLIAMVNIGYPKQIKFSKKKLKPLEEIYSFNKYIKKGGTLTGIYPSHKNSIIFKVKSIIRKFLVRLYTFLRNR